MKSSGVQLVSILAMGAFLFSQVDRFVNIGRGL